MPVCPAIRSSARFLILLVLLGGCSRAVTVSPRELAPASRWTGRYRIITVDDSFAAREFAVTDSTIVITELNSSDSRFGRTRMPLTVPLRDVRSVERYEMDKRKSAVPFVVGGVIVGLYVAAASSF